MRSFSISQLRSGEGAILTRFDHVGPESLPEVLPDLFKGILLVATEEFETWTPPGGEQLEAHVYAFSGEAARAMLRDHLRWARTAGIFAIVRLLPDEDARRRCLPHAMRPWDPERLGALVYGQFGSRYAHRGTWFKDDTQRRAFVEAAVMSVLAERAVTRLPNGDATLVLEMPVDSTFEATYRVSGSGPTISLRRAFPAIGRTRIWKIDSAGEWRAEDRAGGTASHGWRGRLVNVVATAGILILSIPTFFVVALVFAWNRISGSAAPVSSSVRTRT